MLVQLVSTAETTFAFFQRETVVDGLLHEAVDVSTRVDDSLGPFSVVVEAH